MKIFFFYKRSYGEVRVQIPGGKAGPQRKAARRTARQGSNARPQCKAARVAKGSEADHLISCFAIEVGISNGRAIEVGACLTIRPRVMVVHLGQRDETRIAGTIQQTAPKELGAHTAGDPVEIC